MSKLTLTGLALPLFLLFASPQASGPKAFGATKKSCPRARSTAARFKR